MEPDDFDKLSLQQMLDYQLPDPHQEFIKRNFFDHPNDPPKEIKVCGHLYRLVEDAYGHQR